ncbi:MAG: hypothetical protein AAF567_13320 [Actinomycetota bacterium]
MASTIRKIAAAVIALAGTTGVLFGVPLLLIGTVGNPLPDRIPTAEEVRIAVTQTGDGFAALLLAVLAIVVWILWAQFVAAFVVEVAAVVRNRPSRSLPLTPGIQGLAARSVAAIALALTLSLGPVAAPAIQALDLGPRVEPAVPAPTEQRFEAQPHSGFATTAFAGTSSPRADLGGAPTQTIPHRASLDLTIDVEMGTATELWDVAVAAYGDGLRWKDIAHANLGRIDAAGALMTPNTEVVPQGTVLSLPATSDIDAALLDGSLHGSLHRASIHIVAPGESMWSIAEDRVATAAGAGGPGIGHDLAATTTEHWSDVVAANAQVRSGDADVIFPGERLLLPPVDVESTSERVYTLEAPPNVAPAEPPSAETEASPGLNDSTEPAPGRGSDGAGGAVAAMGHVAVGATAPAPSSPSSSPPEPARTSPARPDRAAPVPSGSRSMVGSGGTIERGTSAPPSAQIQVAEDPSAVTTPQRQEPASGGGAWAAPRVFGGAVLGTGAVLLSVGLVAALRRRRALQWRARRAGHRPLGVPAETAAFERLLGHAASHVVDAELRNWRVSPAFGPPGSDPSVIEIVTDEHGHLRLDLPADHPRHALAKPASETADLPDQEGAAIEAREDGRGLDDPRPAATEPGPRISVIIGTSLEAEDGADVDRPHDERLGDGRAVLLDLVPGAQVELDGTPEACRSFVRTAALDLAVSPRDGDVHVVAVGIDHGLDDLERLSAVASWSEAIGAVAAVAGDRDDDLAAPVVVLAADTPPVEVANRLDAVALMAPGLSVTTRLELGTNTITVEPAGIAVRSMALADDEFRSIGELVESSALDAQELAIEEPLDLRTQLARPTTVGNVLAVPDPDLDDEIEVRILGPVEVDGASRFSSVKAVDVIAYLAFHRHGVDADQLKSWIWPPYEPPTDKAFANVMSRARTGLGTAHDGTPYLSRAGSDRLYRLDPRIRTDFDRFEALLAAAERVADEPARQLEMLRLAIDLVRGVPFSGGTASSFGWADHAIRSHVQFTIDEAIHWTVDLALELGDLTSARVAVLKGLELVPGCEQCFRRRFLVAQAGNNRQELRRAMADLERTSAAELGEPEGVDYISRDLLSLFEEIDRKLVAGGS